jgi:uncharacterized RmlC-like cupin family protein
MVGPVSIGDRQMTISQATVLKGVDAPSEAEQGSMYAAGVSAETTGANALWMGKISLPAGRRTKAHFHASHETALYMISGEAVDLFTGARLERHETARPGDFVFIPAGLPHVAINRSGTTALFVGARTDPNANESVVMLPELDDEFAKREAPHEGGETANL